jgi:hypothetical protein
MEGSHLVIGPHSLSELSTHQSYWLFCFFFFFSTHKSTHHQILIFTVMMAVTTEATKMTALRTVSILSRKVDK